MAFASNIAAMNAAKSFTKQAGFDPKAYKEYFAIEKLDGEWHSLQIAEFPKAREPHSCLISERDGIFAFPSEQNAIDRAITSGKLHLIGASDAEAEAELGKAMAEADRIADSQQSAAALPNGKEWIRISSVAKPTKFVWHVADRMVAEAAAAGRPAPSRKEVQDECIRLGVASGTARTQYQAWKSANDAAHKNAALAAELSAKLNSRS